MFFIRGFIIGIIIGIPVGTIGALTIRSILNDGVIHGLVCGLASTTADFIYGCIVAFGLTFISDFLIKYQTSFRLIGAGLVLLVGIKIYRSKNKPKVSTNYKSLLKVYISTFFISISNPTTIISFLIVFAAYGVSGTCNYSNALELVTGVFCGAGMWWVIVILIVNIFKHKIDERRLNSLNKVFGIIIMGFGLMILASFIKDFIIKI